MEKYRGKTNLQIVRSYLEGTRPFITVGYTGKQYIKRKVGEQWTDGKNITWEQKEGGPTRINRVAEIVKKAIGNEKCSCGQEIRFGNKLDNLFYRKTGMCSNCLIDYETKLRIVGVYPDYEAMKLISNEIGFLKDIKEKISDTIKFFSEGTGDSEMICNSEGFIERWKNTNKDKILEDARKDLKLVSKRISSLSKIKTKFKKVFINNAKKYNLETYV